MTSTDPTWTFWRGKALMADELNRWAAERAAQRCDECRYFAPIGGTRDDGRCKHGKPQTYTRGCDRCDAYERGRKHEHTNMETFAAATAPRRWILEAPRPEPKPQPQVEPEPEEANDAPKQLTSVELRRKDVENWIHDCYVAADFLRMEQASDVYCMYQRWRPQYARKKASATIFCQIVNEHFGANAMRNEKQLCEREAR